MEAAAAAATVVVVFGGGRRGRPGNGPHRIRAAADATSAVRMGVLAVMLPRGVTAIVPSRCSSGAKEVPAAITI